MNLLHKAAKVAGASATFVTSAFLATPVLASGYTYDYYTSTSDAAAATGFLGLGFVYICCVCLIPLIIDAVLSYVVYKDAKKNNVENPILWALITFFLPLVGILVYFLAIRPEALKKNVTTTVTSTPVEPTESDKA